MEKIKYFSLCTAVALLAGCGGSGSDDSSQSNTTPDPKDPKPPVETVSKCDRGVLLNSILPAETKSIFDEPLYQLAADISHLAPNYDIRIYMNEFKRDGQMLYSTLHGLNLTDQLLDQEEAEKHIDLILNQHGLFTKANYQKQNQGWPAGYIVAAKDQTLTTAQYNDHCDFNASASSSDYEKVDLSGKKIADIFPSLNTHDQPYDVRYNYISLDTFNRMSLNYKTEYSNFLQSGATFPAGSYIYIPKSVIYKDTQFYFTESNEEDVATLEQWKKYAESQFFAYKYKIEKVAGYNVAYSVDAQGNELYYPGADPAMEKDGKIYMGLWLGKGDVISTSYGAQDRSGSNYMEKGQYAYMNASSATFIRQQIQTYYK